MKNDSKPVTHYKPDDSKPDRKKQKKEELPMHNHDPGVIPEEPCEYCNTYGDIFDADGGDGEYTGIVTDGKSLEDRLTEAIAKDEGPESYKLYKEDRKK